MLVSGVSMCLAHSGRRPMATYALRGSYNGWVFRMVSRVGSIVRCYYVAFLDIRLAISLA